MEHTDQPKPNGKPVITISATRDGYPITITFAGSIEQIPNAIERLQQAGCTPPVGGQQWQTLPDGTPICPKHGAPMRLREKQGDSWHSHKVIGPSGEELWCKGYRGADSPGYEH
jgi:hypothetical protein